MESKDWSGFGYFSPDFSPGMPVSQRIWNPRGFGTPGRNPLADLEPPGPNPLADMDPPSQIWTPLPDFPFKHPLYHIW